MPLPIAAALTGVYLGVGILVLGLSLDSNQRPKTYAAILTVLFWPFMLLFVLGMILREKVKGK